jgi:hypothetical protein
MIRQVRSDMDRLRGRLFLAASTATAGDRMARTMRRKNVGKRPVPNRKKAAKGGRKSSRKGVKNGQSRK